MAEAGRLFSVQEANTALAEVAPRLARLRTIRDEARRQRESLEVLWQRLEDAVVGLVDFPARVRGMPIYLCWRAGEAQWPSGTAGPRGLPAENRSR